MDCGTYKADMELLKLLNIHCAHGDDMCEIRAKHDMNAKHFFY